MRAKVLVHQDGTAVAKLRLDVPEDQDLDEFRNFAAQQAWDRTNAANWHKRADITPLGEAKDACRPTDDGDFISVRVGLTLKTFRVDQDGLRTS